MYAKNRHLISNISEPISKVEDLNHAIETCYSFNVTFVRDDEQFESHKGKYFQIKFVNDRRLDTFKEINNCDAVNITYVF